MEGDEKLLGDGYDSRERIELNRKSQEKCFRWKEEHEQRHKSRKCTAY